MKEVMEIKGQASDLMQKFDKIVTKLPPEDRVDISIEIAKLTATQIAIYNHVNGKLNGG